MYLERGMIIFASTISKVAVKETTMAIEILFNSLVYKTRSNCVIRCPIKFPRALFDRVCKALFYPSAFSFSFVIFASVSVKTEDT